MKKNTIIDFLNSYTFLGIAVLISFYFGWHGYYFLLEKWQWEPWQLSFSTIFLVEIVFLNVFRANSYSKVGRIPVFIFGFLALVFTVALPLLSSWYDYQKLDRVVESVVAISEPEYYAKEVIPALQDELLEAELVIAPRSAERKRRMAIGPEIYSKGAEGVSYTGFQAAGWIPYGETEKADFKKVADLKKKIREYRESDKDAKNSYESLKNSASAALKTVKSDKSYGWWALWFKFALIIFLGVSSLYYMYSYSNPEVKKDASILGGESETKTTLLSKIKAVKKETVIRSKWKLSVIEKYPDAEAITSKDKSRVDIISGGEVIGSSNNAANAWINASKSS